MLRKSKEPIHYYNIALGELYEFWTETPVIALWFLDEDSMSSLRENSLKFFDEDFYRLQKVRFGYFDVGAFKFMPIEKIFKSGSADSVPLIPFPSHFAETKLIVLAGTYRRIEGAATENAKFLLNASHNINLATFGLQKVFP